MNTCKTNVLMVSVFSEISVLSVDEEAERGQRGSQFGGLAAGSRQEGVVLELLEGRGAVRTFLCRPVEQEVMFRRPFDVDAVCCRVLWNSEHFIMVISQLFHHPECLLGPITVADDDCVWPPHRTDVSQSGSTTHGDSGHSKVPESVCQHLRPSVVGV